MKRTAIFLLLLNLCAFAQTKPFPRPHILGIDHVSFYTTNPDGVKKLYADLLGLTSAAPTEPGETLRYLVGTQWVGYSPAPDARATDRMDHVAFATDNIAGLRRYLAEKGFKPSQIQGQSDHSLSFTMNDPEGHHIEFVERTKADAAPAPSAVSRHMIHAGFLVYNRGAEDHFYRDLLGFRPYWHGGMKDDETDWVSLQVPDGTDWLGIHAQPAAASGSAVNRRNESHLARRGRHEEGAGHPRIARLEAPRRRTRRRSAKTASGSWMSLTRT